MPTNAHRANVNMEFAKPAQNRSLRLTGLDCLSNTLDSGTFEKLVKIFLFSRENILNILGPGVIVPLMISKLTNSYGRRLITRTTEKTDRTNPVTL